ncbi:MAG TPA: F0F1 ATP synthase subunit A [Verrucomicrobiota bacterium]|nr:F0F1 ATP synthase subunit A [Verrucomicrobiota bacterium]HRR64839.1 F0F1 ATP synthase subunit A [Candidatus Paceibacterota bacterium]HNR71117.1 F0F1 ATP synthase subunit A [Verrucomicrobiota bacterium]HNS69735.1 F0F1 ATP synthase subunit A [Verrucomicrobiota bacterium]HNW07540.1 F0F1 ATP synthase subunit A [Verrucomicrobiota bacterium]
MIFISWWLAVLFGTGLAGAASSALAADAAAVSAAAAPALEEGLSPDAPRLGPGGASFINSSMVATWGVALMLILLVRRATRRMQLAPEGAQNFWEWLVEMLHDFLEGIIGGKLVKKTFWFFATLFIFILFTNWFGLLPGVGSIGWGTQTPEGFHVERPLLRGGNADLNMTFAMAMIFFVCWIVWAVQAVGVKGVFLDLFGPKGDTAGALKYLMIVVFFLVGFLEVLSILFRPISLSFRLYGNIFAGENMLEAMGKLVPGLGWLLPVPFYFMELLVGIVQALVFMLLTAVFTMLICVHEESPGGTGH